MMRFAIVAALLLGIASVSFAAETAVKDEATTVVMKKKAHKAKKADKGTTESKHLKKAEAPKAI